MVTGFKVRVFKGRELYFDTSPEDAERAYTLFFDFQDRFPECEVEVTLNKALLKPEDLLGYVPEKKGKRVKPRLSS